MPSRFKESLGFIKMMRSEKPYHTQHGDDFDVKYLEEPSDFLESSPATERANLLNGCSSFYHNLYAAFTILYEIDIVLDQIEYEGISLSNAEELVDSCSILHVVSTNVIMDIDDKFSFAKKYSLAQDIYIMAKNVYHAMLFVHSVLPENLPREEHISLTQYDEVESRLCCKYIRTGAAVLKLFYVLTVLQTSPLYSDGVHQIAKKLIQLLREVLYNKRIIKMVVDADTKGRNDKSHKTTRLKIYFTLGNSDRYCIRLDFPHKGEESIHLNLNEPVRKQSSGFPFLEEEHAKALAICGSQTVFDELFFYCDELYWFRSNYAAHVKELRKTNETQGKALEEFHHEQAHIKISSSDQEDRAAVTEFSEAFAEAIIDYENIGIYGRTDSDDSMLYKYILFLDHLFDVALQMKNYESHIKLHSGDAAALEAFRQEKQATVDAAVKDVLYKYIYKNFPEDEKLMRCADTATGLCDLLEKSIDVLDQVVS